MFEIAYKLTTVTIAGKESGNMHVFLHYDDQCLNSWPTELWKR